MGGIDVNVDLFPLVRITHDVVSGDGDYLEMIEAMRKVTDRQTKFVNLVSAPGPTVPSATQRKLISDWYVRNRETFNTYSIGTAVLAKNALQSGAITAIMWIMRPQNPVVSFTAPAEALAWCHELLREHEVPMAPSLLDFLGRRDTGST